MLPLLPPPTTSATHNNRRIRAEEAAAAGAGESLSANPLRAAAITTANAAASLAAQTEPQLKAAAMKLSVLATTLARTREVGVFLV